MRNKTRSRIAARWGWPDDGTAVPLEYALAVGGVRVGACLEWTGTRTRQGRGYGLFQVDGQTVVVSRAMWELTHGMTIPEGLVIRHTCDNAPCYEPLHLLIGTHMDNSRDRWSRRPWSGEYQMVAGVPHGLAAVRKQP